MYSLLERNQGRNVYTELKMSAFTFPFWKHFHRAPKADTTPIIAEQLILEFYLKSCIFWPRIGCYAISYHTNYSYTLVLQPIFLGGGGKLCFYKTYTWPSSCAIVKAVLRPLSSLIEQLRYGSQTVPSSARPGKSKAEQKKKFAI